MQISLLAANNLNKNTFSFALHNFVLFIDQDFLFFSNKSNQDLMSFPLDKIRKAFKTKKTKQITSNKDFIKVYDSVFVLCTKNKEYIVKLTKHERINLLAFIAHKPLLDSAMSVSLFNGGCTVHFSSISTIGGRNTQENIIQEFTFKNNLPLIKKLISFASIVVDFRSNRTDSEHIEDNIQDKDQYFIASCRSTFIELYKKRSFQSTLLRNVILKRPLRENIDGIFFNNETVFIKDLLDKGEVNIDMETINLKEMPLSDDEVSSLVHIKKDLNLYLALLDSKVISHLSKELILYHSIVNGFSSDPVFIAQIKRTIS